MFAPTIPWIEVHRQVTAFPSRWKSVDDVCRRFGIPIDLEHVTMLFSTSYMEWPQRIRFCDLYWDLEREAIARGLYDEPNDGLLVNKPFRHYKKNLSPEEQREAILNDVARCRHCGRSINPEDGGNLLVPYLCRHEHECDYCRGRLSDSIKVEVGKAIEIARSDGSVLKIIHLPDDEAKRFVRRMDKYRYRRHPYGETAMAVVFYLTERDEPGPGQEIKAMDDLSREDYWRISDRVFGRRASGWLGATRGEDKDKQDGELGEPSESITIPVLMVPKDQEAEFTSFMGEFTTPMLAAHLPSTAREAEVVIEQVIDKLEEEAMRRGFDVYRYSIVRHVYDHKVNWSTLRTMGGRTSS